MELYALTSLNKNMVFFARTLAVIIRL